MPKNQMFQTLKLNRALIIGLLALIVYTTFLTRQFAGDGLRFFSDMTGSWPPNPGGTNHLLFPLVGWLWFHLLGQYLPMSNPIAAIQLMNAVFGAIAVGLVGAFLQQWSLNGRSIWLASLSLIFASAFWPGATDMVEVMPSVPLMLWSFWLLNRFEEPTWPRILLAALGLALATSVYQAALFSGLGLAYLIWWQSGISGLLDFKRRLAKVGVFGGTVFAALLIIYVFTFRFLGNADSMMDALRLSFETESPYAFGYFAWRHIAGALAGWVTAWIGLFDFQGLTIMLAGLSQGRIFPDWVNLGLILLQYFLFGAFLIMVWVGSKRALVHRIGRERLTLLALWFIPHFIFLIYWIPAYSKLWIPPLITIICLFALLIDELPKLPERYRNLGWSIAIGLVLVVVLFNLSTGLWPSRFDDNLAMEDALAIAESYIGTNDVLITDGWGPTSVYVAHFTDRRWVGLANVALANPGETDVVVDHFDREIAAAQARGGEIFFVGILDLEKNEWEPLFGSRFGMEFAAFDKYRQRAEKVMVLQELTNRGNPIHLWRLEPGVESTR